MLTSNNGSTRRPQGVHNDRQKTQNRQSWRDVLSVHPAADLFPLMSKTDPAALRELGEDIKKNGLASRIVLWSPACGSKTISLIDGRNRLDAMELVGLDTSKAILPKEAGATHADPYAYVIAANIHRRHLTAEDKRELIAKVIEAQPHKSSREIARQVKASPTVVAQERKELSKRGQLPDKTIGKDGKERPAKRKTKPESPTKKWEREHPEDKRCPSDPDAAAAWRRKRGIQPKNEQHVFASPQEAHGAKPAKPLSKQEMRELSDSWLAVHSNIKRGNLTGLKDALQMHRDKIDRVLERLA